MRSYQRLIAIMLVMTLALGCVDVTAFAESVIALPASVETIEEEAYLGSKSIDRVILPDGIIDIQDRAFAFSSVTTINLPSSLQYIADNAFEGSSLKNVAADEETYAYDWAVEHHYIIPGEPINISSVSANVTTVELGTPVTWTVEASGNYPPLTYNYAVYNNGTYREDLSSFEKTEKEISIVPDGDGYFTMLATVEDSRGHVLSKESDPILIVDTEKLGDINVALNPEKSVYLVGDTVNIRAIAHACYGTINYTFEVKNAAGESQMTRQNENLLSFTPEMNGLYMAECAITDELGRSTKNQVEIQIFTTSELKPDKPEILRVNDLNLADEPQNAPVLAQQKFTINWKESDKADSYRIRIDKAEGNGWSEWLDEEGLSDSSYVLQGSAFSEIEQNLTLRVTVEAKNTVYSDPTIGYFSVKTLEAGRKLLINGKENEEWNEVYRFAAERVFSVNSDLPWTVSSEDPWITYSVDGDELTAYLTENTSSDRNGTIKISNGYHESLIVVDQSDLRKAPQLINPVMSERQENSTLIPYGNLTINFTESGYYAVAKLYRLTENGYLPLVEKATKEASLTLPVNDSFVAGDHCMLELIGYSEKAYLSKDPSAQKVTNRYYFVFDDSSSNYFILADGQENVSYNIIKNLDVNIHASTGWSYESDSEWLDIFTRDEFAADSVAKVCADVNTTSQQRIGHITLRSGTATALITVQQNSFIPYLSYPAGLSTDASAPTSIPYNNTTLIWHMADDYLIEDLSDGSKLLWGSSAEIDPYDYEEFEKAELKPNTKYKVTLSNDYCSAEYFFKTGGSTSYYINISDDQITEASGILWSIAPGLQTRQIKLKANGSWTISSNSDWLTVSSASGSSTATGKSITVTIAPNTTGIDRSGSLTFSRGSNAQAILYVEQSAEDPLILLNDETLTPYTSERAYSIPERIRVLTKRGFTVTSNAQWLAFDSKGSKTITVTSDDKRLTLYYDENPAGNLIREASLTFTTSTQEFVLRVYQLPEIEAPLVSSAIKSLDKDNPDVITVQDIPITWMPIKDKNVVQYYVTVDLATGKNKYYFDADGSELYSFTIPWSSLNADARVNSFYVAASDGNGKYAYDGKRYFQVIPGDTALLNGSMTPVWENATDLQITKEFTVVSNAEWKATTDQTWIHLSQTTGENGSVLSVTLDNNTSSSKRFGSVCVSVNGNVTELIISQCAKLSEFPTIQMPLYSTNEEQPTVIPTTKQLTVSWTSEPQTDFYMAQLMSFKEGSVWHIEAKSDRIYPKNSEETWSFDYPFETDVLYRATIIRYISGRASAGSSIFFIPHDGESEISLGDTEKIELTGESDYDYIRVRSSGTWIATTDSDWILLSNRSLNQDDLNEAGTDVEDYFSYIGNDNTYLYISALPNTTKLPRSGSITVTCGNKTVELSVIQDIQIDAATLMSPALGSSSSQMASVTCRMMNLRWTVSERGTGKYRVVLKEKAYGERKWETVLETHSLSTASYSIPASYFEAGNDYQIRIITETSGLYEPYNVYYCHAVSDDEITAELTVNSDYVYPGGKVSLNVKASGGIGKYLYGFTLLKNGNTVNELPYDTINSCVFPIEEAGRYQIKVYVKDAVGTVYEGYTASFEANDATPDGGQTVTLDIDGDQVNVPRHSSNNDIISDEEGNPPTHNPDIPEPTLRPRHNDNAVVIVKEDDDTSEYTVFEKARETFYFEMSVDTTTLNRPVSFEVYAKDADKVCLIVDGTYCDKYDVRNNSVTFERSFSQSGNRKISFARMINGEWYDCTEEQTLCVKATTRTLDPVTVESHADIKRGDDAVIVWHTVENAEQYKIFMFCDQTEVLTYTAARSEGLDVGTPISLTVPSNYLQKEGNYLVNIMAIAEDYNSSENYTTFKVLPDTSVITVEYPKSGARYNIGETMDIWYSITKSCLYEKLIVVDEIGAVIEYLPDETGHFGPEAVQPGIFTMQIMAADNPEYRNPYTGKSFTVYVEGPSVSVKDSWNEKYGTVYVGETFSGNIYTNSIGKVEAYIDDRPVDITKVNDKQYTVSIAGLTEGKHKLRAILTFDDIESDPADLYIYGITKLADDDCRILYATEDTLFCKYPDAIRTSTVAYKSPVSVLGTYGDRYAYVRFGTLYGFVPKNVLDELSVIEEREAEEAQEEQLAATEEELREWAAQFINDYFFNYAQLYVDKGTDLQVDFKMPWPRRTGMFFAGKEIANVETTSTTFYGMNRNYYLIALYKRYFDFNDRMTAYNTVQRDSESDADFKARIKPLYQLVFIKTLEGYMEVDTDSYDRISNSGIGKTELVYNPQTGHLEATVVENGQFANLEEQAKYQTANAITDFIFESANMAAAVYETVTDPADTNKLIKILTNAVTGFLDKVADASFENQLQRLADELYVIQMQAIANANIEDARYVLACLNSIGDDVISNAPASHRSIIQEVKDELVELITTDMVAESEQNARELLADWYISEASIKETLTQSEMFELIADAFVEETVKAICDIILAESKDAIKGKTTENAFLKDVIIYIDDFICELLKVFVTSTLNDRITELKTDVVPKRDEKKDVVDIIMKTTTDFLTISKKYNDTKSDDYSYLIVKSLIECWGKILEVAEKHKDNENRETLFRDILVLLGELVSDAASTYAKDKIKNGWKDMSSNLKKGTEKITNTCCSILSLKDEIWKTGKALGNLILSVHADGSNEAQVSLLASGLYHSYEISSGCINNMRIKLLQLNQSLQEGVVVYNVLTDKILDPNQTSVKEIIDILDSIYLQIKTDNAASKDMIDLLEKCEKSKFKPYFYQDLLYAIEDTPWEGQITIEQARIFDRLVGQFCEKYNKGWKEAYRDLAD